MSEVTSYMGLRGPALSSVIGATAGLAFFLFGYDQGDLAGLLTVPSFRKQFPQADTIGFPESAHVAEHLLWAAYDAIRCPTLLIRGKNSDLLSHDTAEAMTKRGPKAELIEIPAVGHAPTFLTESQIEIAKQFLLR